ncbi:restriction endonuclease subunit S [Streptomyces sp. SS8]
MRGEGETAAAERNWPGSWRRVTLAEAGQWLSGGTPSTSNEAFWGGDIPWISGASLKEFHLANSDRRLTRLGAVNGSRLVPKGATLFVVRGMSLKSEFRIGVAERELAFGQDCKAIIPADGIDPYFLAYAIRVRAPEILSMVEETSHGTGRLDTGRLKGLEIPIPSITEQRRVVATQVAFERRVEVIERLMQKQASVLDALVSTLLHESAHDFRTLDDLSDSIIPGITLGSHRVPRRKPSGYLRVANVRKGRINASDLSFLEADEKDHARYGLVNGDILVVEGHADPDQIGRSAVVGEAESGLLYQNHLFRVRFTEVLPEFAMLWLNSATVRSYWKKHCATSSGLYTLNSKLLSRVPFPCVEFSEQERIVAAWRSVKNSLDVLKKEAVKLRMVQRAVCGDLLGDR